MNTKLEHVREMLYRGSWVIPHTDADGLAAGAIALRARGEAAKDAILLPRGLTPFAPGAPLPVGDPVIVLDWGVRKLERPALLIDHHVPETDVRQDQLLLSSYGERPEASTSVLMARVLPDEPRWLGALGAFGDFGDGAWDLKELSNVSRALVRRLAAIVNAPRRLPHGPVRLALELLVEHDDPRSALSDPRSNTLAECKAEWTAGFKRALKTAPDVRDGVAVLRFSSPYQVHPLVASAWARRLAPNLVVAANDGYLPGMVNFAVRRMGELDLRRLLQSALPRQSGEFAHGHPRATGGSLAPGDFDRLIEQLRALVRDQ
jgi:single-stranded-DNA-specific exonuclease